MSANTVPADIRVVDSKDLFVSQSSLTGESDATEKRVELQERKQRSGSVVELENICYMGSNIVSGMAIGIVFATGRQTYLGTIAKSLVGVRAQTSFDKGITKGDWFEAFVFAISIAVGLTPEMLPMIVTSNLAKGAMAMSRQKTIVKNLNSIQSFGAMNILCTDKTGTLTRDKIVLEKYLNVHGDDDLRVLRHAYFNSYFQTGLKNLMDKAILSHAKDTNYYPFAARRKYRRLS